MRVSRSVMAAVAGAAVLAAGGAATAAVADSGTGGAPVTAAPATAATASAAAASPAAHTFRERRNARAIHGEFVVRTADGYRTVDVQRGRVTAVSGSSLTVRSDDGFTGSYSVTGDTVVHHGKEKVDISTVKVGDKVRVVARVDGGTHTALRVFVPAH
jgi:hypothetical protein